MPRLGKDIVLAEAEEEKLSRRLEELHLYRTEIEGLSELKEGALKNHMRVMQLSLEKRVCALEVGKRTSGKRTEASGRSEGSEEEDF